MTKFSNAIQLKNLLLFTCLFLAGTVACAQNTSPLRTVFEEFNKCDSVECAARYLDGVMLKQLQSLKPKNANEILRHLKLSSYEAKSKIIGEYGALFISSYKGPETQGGITMVYLFEKQNGSWKIYHRLPEDRVDSRLRPITQ